jgi:uncharacterized lipoprotein (TIGR02269 family)
MGSTHFSRGLPLLAVLLTACATLTPLVHEGDEAAEAVSSWEEARADPSCVVPLCDEERCAVWRCRDVVEVEAPRGVEAPATVADPVFEIPWHNWKTREPRVARHLRHWQCSLRPKEPYEKHHIFPQATEFALWFKRQGIDIHAFTIRLPRSFHQWLHSGGPNGGQWNEAWRQFRRGKQRATAEQMWAFAGELMSRFGVNGPLVPYYCD